MKWYLAKLIFSIDIESAENQNSQPAQFDEQFRLIEGLNKADAYLKCCQIGKNQENSFKTSNNKRVTWRFIDVNEILLIDELADGVEIYSTTIETTDKENYISSVLRRSVDLQLSKSMA